MNVRNRMVDVVKLRCNACQDFLKMIIVEGWQQIIYNKAKKEVDTNGRFKDKYISAYEKMREIGIDNYNIDNMDVTFISEIVHGCRIIAPTNEKTRIAIEQLTEDRNLTNHSNENEEDEELYLRGLLALCNLKDFVRAVDKYETNIGDEKRIEYRSKYSKRIDDLKDILDEERICLIQKRKDIECDIRRILDCNDEKQRLNVWCKLSELYMDRYWKIEKNYERYGEFMVKASDAGIKEAHGNAANYFFLIKKDYAEGERKLYMLFESAKVLPACDAKFIIDMINYYLDQDNELTEGMDKLINQIIEQGYPVEKNEDGLYVWPKKVITK